MVKHMLRTTAPLSLFRKSLFFFLPHQDSFTGGKKQQKKKKKNPKKRHRVGNPRLTISIATEVCSLL